MASKHYEKMLKKIEIDDRGCWIFQGCKDHFGYGKQSIGNSTWDRAHRVSYRENYGDIPKGMCVLHKCDVPACCNPEHLFLGSKADNNADKAKKARSKKKLSSNDVLKIQIMQGTHQAIADIFGVSRSMITLIKNGKQGKYL